MNNTIFKSIKRLLPYSIKILFLFIGMNLFHNIEAKGEVTYFLYDTPCRSVVQLTNVTGNIANSYVYDSFGNVKAENRNISNPFKYVGEHFDEETGFIYLRNRYYDPVIGRFITKDLFSGIKQVPHTKNPYAYCSNNPINYTDPHGLYVFWDDLIFAGVGGIAGVISQGIGDLIKGEWSGGEAYAGAFLGGVVAGETLLYTANPILAGAAGASVSNVSKQWLEVATGTRKMNDLSTIEAVGETALGGLLGGVGGKVFGPSIFAGRGGYQAITKQIITKASLGQIGGFSSSTAGKMIAYRASESLSGVYFKGLRSAGERIGSDFLDSDYNSYIDPASPSDFGGVSLSLTASLMLEINDIMGAGFDEGTGQMILYGKQDVALPEMELDDLSVAVRSVYGYGGKTPQDPGVSIGTEPSDQEGQMKVRYDGQTKDTAFGSVMFEADRLLKTLTLGKDNITGQPVGSGVSGYKNMLERYKAAGGAFFPEGDTSDRMWFVPQAVTLIQSEDDGSMMFDAVKMKLLTESKFKEDVYDNPVAEGFASHFTAHYDEFAATGGVINCYNGFNAGMVLF